MGEGDENEEVEEEGKIFISVEGKFNEEGSEIEEDDEEAEAEIRLEGGNNSSD